jgi:hypothetical protein
MTTTKIFALILIAAGTLGLAYGTFSYTKESHEAKLGSLEITVKEKERVNIPVWAGTGAIAAGTILLLVGRRS